MRLASSKGDGIERSAVALIDGSRKPNLLAFRRPGQSPCAEKTIGKDLVVALPVNHVNSAGVVTYLWMLEESDALSVRGNAGMADPAGGFVDHLADRELQAVLTAQVADDG